jgi:hypothetical protein
MTARPRMPSLLRSLSARLLELTVLFGMVSEVLIFAPSAGRFRLSYLEERSAAGYTAILALMATPNNMVSDELERELLNQAGAYVIGLRRPDGVKLMLGPEPPPPVDASFDLRERGFFMLIGDAFETLFQSDNRVLRIVAPSPRHPQAIVEIAIDEAPMRMALIDYSYRILALSIVISLVTAAFVYLTLQWLLVRPMRRMTESMMAFRENPEDLSRPLPVSTRTDELGVAQAELADMQAKLRAAAAEDTLGRARHRCHQDQPRSPQHPDHRPAGRRPPRRQRQPGGQADDADPARRHRPRHRPLLEDADLRARGPAGAEPPALPPAQSDRRGRRRPAGAGERPAGLAQRHRRRDRDRRRPRHDVPRLIQPRPERPAGRRHPRRRARAAPTAASSSRSPTMAPAWRRARDNRFPPSAASARAGGSGLGLAIARDLMHAHGGDIRLARSDAEGTVFELELPVEG